jgi:hypothetical protein
MPTLLPPSKTDFAPCDKLPMLPPLMPVERPPDPALVAAGWERRFMADGLRLREYTELYESMGYEVRAEQVKPEEISDQCSDCRLLICRQFLTLYTRRRASGSAD